MVNVLISLLIVIIIGGIDESQIIVCFNNLFLFISILCLALTTRTHSIAHQRTVYQMHHLTIQFLVMLTARHNRVAHQCTVNHHSALQELPTTLHQFGSVQGR